MTRVWKCDISGSHSKQSWWMSMFLIFILFFFTTLGTVVGDDKHVSLLCCFFSPQRITSWVAANVWSKSQRPGDACQLLLLGPADLIQKHNLDFWTQCKLCVSSCRWHRMVTKATSAGCRSLTLDKPTFPSTNLNLSRAWKKMYGRRELHGTAQLFLPLRLVQSSRRAGEDGSGQVSHGRAAAQPNRPVPQSYKQVSQKWQRSSPSP